MSSCIYIILPWLIYIYETYSVPLYGIYSYMFFHIKGILSNIFIYNFVFQWKLLDGGGNNWLLQEDLIEESMPGLPPDFSRKMMSR